MEIYLGGSVVPTFISQAVTGEPLTVTEPNMTRFMLSIEDVLSLISHACQQMENVEITARKRSACRVQDLGWLLAGFSVLTPLLPSIFWEPDQEKRSTNRFSRRKKGNI